MHCGLPFWPWHSNHLLEYCGGAFIPCGPARPVGLAVALLLHSFTNGKKPDLTFIKI